MADNLYQSLTIVVIEDSDFQRTALVRMLSGLGFANVFEARDGSAGLQVVRETFPDLVLCDIEMEPMDGLSFLRDLRRADEPMIRDVPVVFLTSRHDSAIVLGARALGVQAFVVKPAARNAIISRLDFALGISR